MKITTIGLDLAKNVFHVVCCDWKNNVLKKKELKRIQVLRYFANIEPCSVAMEACATSNYWGREIGKLGHQVKLIAPQHVKAFLTGNKNDYNDAYAIVIAANQPHINAVAVKTQEQQDNQAVHKIRELAVRQRTALSNQLRGLLLENGISARPGIKVLKKLLIELIDDTSTKLSATMKFLLGQLYDQLEMLELQIEEYDRQIRQLAANNSICELLQSIPGFGPVVASAYFNEVGNGHSYKRGRDVSASLGLVPKQYSSGGKERLLGISKKGNRYLRCLMVQGAKAVVTRAKQKSDKLSQWINKLVAQRGHNRACIAYANKMARIAWAVTTKAEKYKPVQQSN